MHIRFGADLNRARATGVQRRLAVPLIANVASWLNANSSAERNDPSEEIGAVRTTLDGPGERRGHGFDEVICSEPPSAP